MAHLRFRQLMSIVMANFHNNEWRRLLFQLEDYRQRADNIETLNPFTVMLADCEQSLTGWLRCERRLRELISSLPIELRQIISSMQRTGLARPNAGQGFHQRIKEILPLVYVESVRQEIRVTIGEMAMLAERIKQRVLEFLRQYGSPSQASPKPALNG
jgi:hypothetical protein